MEKAIYYREHYYSLPNGTDFDREFENLKEGYADKVCHACRLAFITHNDVEK